MPKGHRRETVKVIVDSLLNAGVKYVFGVPGAKIDSLFNALLDHPEITVIVARHEQNAAFMAAAVGKLTGIPGVCIGTSGPGTSNYVTGLITATDEGSPMVCIVGNVNRVQSAMRTHQSLRTVELLRPVTKKVVNAVVPDQVAEIMVDAFRIAAEHPRGGTAVSLPYDIIMQGVQTTVPAFPSSAFKPPEYGPAPQDEIAKALPIISRAKFPVLFLGARSSDRETNQAIRGFLKKHPVAVLETFQAAGAVPVDLVHLFFGRLGLFRNQPGDKLLNLADVVITVGSDQAEYDASLWNFGNRLSIIHIDTNSADLAHFYAPKVELIGSISDTIKALTSGLDSVVASHSIPSAQSLLYEFHLKHRGPEPKIENIYTAVHPLHFIRILQSILDPRTTVCCDVGSSYVWMSRYFYSYTPGTFLVSNAQQTLGVALPWAIATYLVKREKVVSISGDGAFLFSGMELATAVKHNCDITHFIWNDGHYNMVEFQEQAKYGRSAGIEIGGVDFASYAQSFGATGWRVRNTSQLEEVMREALGHRGVAIVDIAIDYTNNRDLMTHVISEHVA